MKNSDGFTLTEVMAGLLVFAVSAAVMLPALNLVYMERLAVREERAGEEAVQFFLGGIILDKEDIQEGIVQYKDKEFTASIVEKKSTILLCLNWEGVNERKYERCLSGAVKPTGNDISGSSGRSYDFYDNRFFYPGYFHSTEHE